MRERALGMGATLSVTGKPGKGTTVELTVSRSLAYAQIS
jgi:signal transduction histidine kinase